jgi:hypothetical protein
VWRFLAGFALASVLWGGLVLASKQGWIDISLGPEAPPPDDANAVDAPDDATDKNIRTRKKRPPSLKRNRTSAPSAPDKDTLVGDDLRENDPRSINVGANGGEEQLRGTEIEQGFDSVFPQVRRCLILAAGDDPAHGKLIFGLRISSAGKVTGVNLSGPSSVAQGDAGACLRQAASAIHFRSFHGPDMVVHYPLTLE